MFLSDRRSWRRPVAAVGLLALLAALGACGDDDDGADVREIGAEDCPSGSASGSASASGAESGSASGSECPSGSASGSANGSATGLSASELEGSTDNELIVAAVDDYRAYLTEQVDTLVAETTVFTDAVRAGDVEAAKDAFPTSREPWERIEPIAGLVEDIDVAVDARVDDFANEEDPTWTGWHKLEYLLWETGDLSEAGPIADQLDEDLATLQAAISDLELPPAALAVGAAELIQEVSEGKITGEEDRYSHTDLYDFAANVEGSQALIGLLTPALEEADPELLADIEAGFDDLLADLEKYRTEDGGFVPFTDLSEEDIAPLKADLAGLSENLALVAGVLGLE